MGQHELHNALRREADNRIRALWAEAEAEVEEQRTALKREHDTLQQAARQEQRSEEQAVRRTAAAKAELEMRRCRLLARAALAKRLLALAEPLLVELGSANREGVWQSAVTELPVAEWQILTVHPDDAQRARRDFPETEVRTDTTLVGGVIAATTDERIVIDNSLAGRLLRGWPEFLPELTEALEREINNHGSAGPAATG